MENVKLYTEKIYDLLLTYGPKFILAIVVLILGFWITNVLTRILRRRLEKRKTDISLQTFFTSMVNILLKTLVVLSVLGMVGIEVTSFIAILGAAGLAVGLALSGTLQNFAGGVMILIFRPFKTGDYIDALGYNGTVTEIQLFVTILKTPDNKTVILPNGSLSTNSLTNFSTQPTRRVDMTFGIAYTDNIDKAKKILKDLTEKDKRILNDPAPVIAVSELADSSVNIVLRPWVNTSDYWAVYFDMHENVKKEFDKQGISIPFPQNDVHLFKAN